MRRLGIATAAALITTPLTGVAAMASSCAAGSVSSYTMSGGANFDCSVDGVTFSQMSVSPTNVTLTNIVPYIANGEYGLQLNYSAPAVSTAGTADVDWTFTVTGSLLDDIYASLDASGGGTLTENFNPNGPANFTLTGNTSTTETFSPISSTTVNKDQADPIGQGASSIVDAFSVTTTPLPGTLPLFAGGLATLWGFRRKRSKQVAG